MAANPEPAGEGVNVEFRGLGTPELGRLEGIPECDDDDGAATGSGGGGIIEAADGPPLLLLLLPGGGLDLETLLMRSSNMAMSRSGKLPTILYIFSPAWNKNKGQIE